MLVDLRKLDEKKNIAAEASVVRNSQTGVEKEDEKQGRLYLDYLKTFYQIAKMNPKVMLTYSNGAMLDPKTLEAGPVELSSKNLMTRWLNEKKKR